MIDWHLDNLQIAALAIVAIIVIALIVYRVRSGPMELETPIVPHKICASCGKIGAPKIADHGSTLVEIFLWLFFIVPGFFYSLWRRALRHEVCPTCGGRELIPLDTPRATLLKEQFGYEQIDKVREPVPDEIHLRRLLDERRKTDK